MLRVCAHAGDAEKEEEEEVVVEKEADAEDVAPITLFFRHTPLRDVDMASQVVVVLVGVGSSR